jgi:Toluene-4-monooxygenase system protein B (TmoB)
MHVVVITSADTMAEVAQKVAHHSVGKRIRPHPRDMVVYYEGRVVAAHTTVAKAGIRPLQHVFVDYA